MREEVTPKWVKLTPKGLAFCDFAFRDGPAAGLSAEDAYQTGQRLIKEWDGSESLIQMFNRESEWPEEIDA